MARSINQKTITPKSILVVDDQPLVAKTLRLLLTTHRHKVEVAEDGEKALAAYEKGKYDLVITCFSTPRIDGLELARSIKERVPHQPIIMTAAYVESVTKREEKESNIDAVLGTPFSARQLQEALVAVFPGG
jgi:CheY-like chemotaxis protein